MERVNSAWRRPPQYREEVLREVGTVEFEVELVSLRGAGLSGRPDRESDEQHDDAGYHHLRRRLDARLIPAATIRDVAARTASWKPNASAP